MSLLIKRENGFLIDVVAGGDDHVLEPLELELLPDPLHGLPDDSAQVGEVARVDADTNGWTKLQ